jgi:two-component system LytT family response regulator
MRYKTLIVDDEPLARNRLAHLLSHFQPEIELVAEAGDGDEALHILQTKKLDLVFLDIQMPGMSGLEMLQRLSDPPLVIFTTAYDQYALNAFEENAIDYLLKPIEKERLEKAIRKLQRLSNSSQERLQQTITAILQRINQPRRTQFPVKAGDRIFFIEYADIVYFKSDEKIVLLKTADKEYVCDQTLNMLETLLPAEIFVRIHRSAIINLKQVKEAHRWFAGKFRLVMKDKLQSELPLSRSQKHLFGF